MREELLVAKRHRLRVKEEASGYQLFIGTNNRTIIISSARSMGVGGERECSIFLRLNRKICICTVLHQYSSHLDSLSFPLFQHDAIDVDR
jgi:hypothetical protein